ncbi:MAG: VOC family protein [Myxococcales bacterium]|nr:VOC family protein [Myxococcales bacterium]
MSASIRFSHTIVHSRDKRASARFLSEMLGLPEPAAFGHFAVVALAHDASLDFLDAGDFDFQPQHYAFLVDEADFDRVKARLDERGLVHWADPFREQPGAINHHDGGRGLYFDDPDGHLLEVHTRPYGSGGPTA